MWKVILLFGCLVAPLKGQTIAPVIDQQQINKKGQVEGQLMLRNDTLFKESVVIEARVMVKGEDGTFVYAPVPPELGFELSDMSVVLRPKSEAIVFWKAASASKDFHLLLFSSFHTQVKTRDGMGIVVRIGSSVYGCTKEDFKKGCRHTVLTQEGIDPVTPRPDVKLSKDSPNG